MIRAADDRRNASIITSISMRCWSTGVDVGCTMKTSAPADVLVDLERDFAVREAARRRPPEGCRGSRRCPCQLRVALPERIFRSPNPVAISPAPLSGGLFMPLLCPPSPLRGPAEQPPHRFARPKFASVWLLHITSAERRLVGAEGFEPSNTGSKDPRLTTWPRPSLS